MKIEKDPRADLVEDSTLWKILLTIARDFEGGKIFGLMHGLRCGGTRLVWRSKEPPSLRFQLDDLYKSMDRETLLREWLRPNQREISLIVKETAIKASRLEAVRAG